MRNFEDRFMDIQIDMVSLCSEYVQGQADGIYIYCIADSLYSFNVFYNINNKIVRKHLVNTHLPIENQIDTDLQRPLLKMGTKDIEEIIFLCEEYNREHPTEMWLAYDAKRNSLDTKYSYEGRYAKDKELLLDPVDEFEKWFEEVKSEVEGETNY